MTEPLYVGSKANVDFEFEDPDSGEAVDPTAIVVTIQSPSQKVAGTHSTYSFPSAEVVQRTLDGDPIVGAYRAIIPCTEAGPWHGKVTSTGAGAGAKPIWFDVAADVF